MARKQSSKVFREKVVENISSPEQLTDYLKVSNPRIWVILGSIMLFLFGLLVWSSVGYLETTADAVVVVRDGVARVAGTNAVGLRDGLVVRYESQQAIIEDVDLDEFGRPFGIFKSAVSDGTYVGEIVVDSTHPIAYLLESR